MNLDKRKNSFQLKLNMWQICHKHINLMTTCKITASDKQAFLSHFSEEHCNKSALPLDKVTTPALFLAMGDSKTILCGHNYFIMLFIGWSRNMSIINFTTAPNFPQSLPEIKSVTTAGRFTLPLQSMIHKQLFSRNGFVMCNHNIIALLSSKKYCSL